MYQLAHRHVPSLSSIQTPQLDGSVTPCQQPAQRIGANQGEMSAANIAPWEEPANKEMGFSKEVILLNKIFESKPDALLSMFS
jgi:hypothetical protein